MKTNKLLFGLFIAAMSQVALAVDAACNPIVMASEKKMNQSSWHSVATLSNGKRLEFLKADGGFFRNTTGTWTKSPANLDSAEKDMIGQIRSGEIKLSNCKNMGSDSVDGVPVDVISSSIEMAGAPAAESKLYIGKSDGLPYKQLGKTVEVLYRYKGVSAPKI